MRRLFNIFRIFLLRHITIECDHIPHHFRPVPLKKAINWFLTELSVYFKPEKPWGFPTHLLIEPTNHCNIRCALCPVTEGLKRPKGQMPFDLFKQIIDEVADYVFLILLWDWGEPFLNPRVYDMIRYARSKNIQLMSSTNGHVFSRMDNAVKVVDSGLDSLIFALDGISQSTYEKYRSGGSLEQVIRGIRNVVSAKKEAGSRTPLVNIRFIVMKHNEHEVPLLPGFAKNLGVDMLTTRALYPYDDNTGSKTEAAGHPFIPENPEYRRFLIDPEKGTRIRRKKNPCKALWNNPAIHWNGVICPCSFDPHDTHMMGNLNEKSLREIWSGTKYRQMRRQFRRNYRNLALCADCTYAFEGGSCSTEDIIHKYVFV